MQAEYIIEHPTRGVFRQYDPFEDKFHFGWSKPRSDPSNRKFAQLKTAVAVIGEMPKPLRDKCWVMRIPIERGQDYVKVWP